MTDDTQKIIVFSSLVDDKLGEVPSPDATILA